MPMSVQAGLWGLLSGSALLLGALVGWFVPLKQRVVAAIMAFGAGVLISALSFELVDEAWKQGGFAPVAGGFLAGALVYTFANYWLSHGGARHRKRSREEKRKQQADNHPNNSSALAMGALLDGIPESIVIGVSLLKGGGGRTGRGDRGVPVQHPRRPLERGGNEGRGQAPDGRVRTVGRDRHRLGSCRRARLHRCSTAWHPRESPSSRR